jgi:hypothetical protein
MGLTNVISSNEAPSPAELVHTHFLWVAVELPAAYSACTLENWLQLFGSHFIGHLPGFPSRIHRFVRSERPPSRSKGAATSLAAGFGTGGKLYSGAVRL